MKSRDQDIVFEDKLFKACRSLEDEKFWAKYILSSDASEAALRTSSKQVQRSLGYQWKRTSETNQPLVLEFGMLARFKSVKMKMTKLFLYISLALIVGAAGGVLGNSVYDFGKRMFSRPQADAPKCEASQKSTTNSVKPDGAQSPRTNALRTKNASDT